MIISCFRCSNFEKRIESKKTANTGLFATNNINTALSYANNNGFLFLYTLKVNPNEIYEINCNGSRWNQLKINLGQSEYTTDQLIRYIKSTFENIKLIKFNGIIDFGGKVNRFVKQSELKVPTTTFCILDESIIKDGKKPLKLSEIDNIDKFRFSYLTKRLRGICL